MYVCECDLMDSHSVSVCSTWFGSVSVFVCKRGRLYPGNKSDGVFVTFICHLIPLLWSY